MRDFIPTSLIIKGILIVWNNFQNFLILLTEFGSKKFLSEKCTHRVGSKDENSGSSLTL